ncbi:MAG: hypothetical protein MZV49_26430 [Rhodopseudomonas palustris]|nr:hypothetical protein [Rhodopseudomonas palustris]
MVTAVTLGLALAFEPTEPGIDEPAAARGRCAIAAAVPGVAYPVRHRCCSPWEPWRSSSTCAGTGPYAGDRAHHGGQRAGGDVKTVYLFNVRYLHTSVADFSGAHWERRRC